MQQILLEKVNSALGIDGATHLLALTNALDCLPAAPPSKARTLSEILLVYKSHGKVILQAASQKRVELTESDSVVTKVTDMLKLLETSATKVTETPSMESYMELLEAMRTFVDSFTK